MEHGRRAPCDGAAARSYAAMNYADLADLMDEIRAAELAGDLARARRLVVRALALVDQLEAEATRAAGA